MPLLPIMPGAAASEHRMGPAALGAKMGLGLLLVLLGGLIVSGFDRHVETLLVEISPPWLTDLSTRF